MTNDESFRVMLDMTGHESRLPDAALIGGGSSWVSHKASVKT